MGRQQVDNGYQNCAEIADNAGISEWAKLDLQSIQHREYFGHLSILFTMCLTQKFFPVTFSRQSAKEEIKTKWFLLQNPLGDIQ